METISRGPAPIALALEHPWPFYSLCISVFLVAAFLWWWLPTREKHVSAKKALRTDLSLFFTGSVVAAGILGAIIQFQSNVDREHQQQRLSLSSENAKRYDGAVTRLGKTSQFSRLAAVYTLGELSKQDGFYWPSIAILSAHLKQALRETESVNNVEVHSILNILSKRTWDARNGDPFPLDFSFTDWEGLQFSQLLLWGNNFQFANFSNAILPGAKLESADLHCANFEQANFLSSFLHDPTGPAELGPKLENANFRMAKLNAVTFKSSSVNVENACFEGADLAGADISGFDLTKVAGLSVEQINSTKSHPVVPANFRPKPCQRFDELCPRNAKALRSMVRP